MRRKNKKTVLKGGKRDFSADRVRKSDSAKKVGKLMQAAIPERHKLVIKKTSRQASGSHGTAYNLSVFKGRQKTGLVVKEYHESFLRRFPAGSSQSSIAMKEFEVFQKLRGKGYHIPPTIRLVEVNNVKYVALTDLTKFGKVLTKSRSYMEAFAGKKALEEADKYVEKEIETASLKEGIDINDSWEYVYNEKTGKVRAFILDLGITLKALRAKRQ